MCVHFISAYSQYSDIVVLSPWITFGMWKNGCNCCGRSFGETNRSGSYLKLTDSSEVLLFVKYDSARCNDMIYIDNRSSTWNGGDEN